MQTAQAASREAIFGDCQGASRRAASTPGSSSIATRGGDVYYEDVDPFAQALRRLTAAALPHGKSVAMIAAMRRDFR